MFHDSIITLEPTIPPQETKQRNASQDIHAPRIAHPPPHPLRVSHNKPISHMPQHPPPLLMMRKPRHVTRDDHSVTVHDRVDERKVFLEVGERVEGGDDARL